MSEWVEEYFYFGLGEGDTYRTDGNGRYQYRHIIGWTTTLAEKTETQYVTEIFKYELADYGDVYNHKNIAAFLVSCEDIRLRCSRPYHVGHDPAKEEVTPAIWLEGWRDCTKEEYESAKEGSM